MIGIGNYGQNRPVMHDVIAIEERYQRAREAVSRLCQGERWTMRVPVDRELDHDMVIRASLDDVPKLIEMLHHERKQRQNAE